MSELPHNRITRAELDAMPAKARKHPHVAKLYMEHDFLEAYAMHTDMRVAESPEGAIGSQPEWECHGAWQMEFLLSQGLQPHNDLIEIGCGTGRLARKIVPYLNDGGYVGVDISTEAIAYAKSLAKVEGWSKKNPVFHVGNLQRFQGLIIDYFWAFSVFIHLPAWAMTETMRQVADLMGSRSKFYFSYVPEKADSRTGCKQFRHSLATYKQACKDADLTFNDVPWLHQQRIGLATLC